MSVLIDFFKSSRNSANENLKKKIIGRKWVSAEAAGLSLACFSKLALPGQQSHTDKRSTGSHAL